MSNVLGQSMITTKGFNALLAANNTGVNIKPKYFKFSDQEITLDDGLVSSDIEAWITQDINQYQVIDEAIIEFICDVSPDKAVKNTKVVGLYLEDDTLFMVAKPPYPFPPNLRQTFKIQMAYENATSIMDFKYIDSDQSEQDLSHLNSIVVGGNQILKNTMKIEKIKIQGVK